jgi:uncharacterized protein YbjT (DUF2867 family)
MKVIVLGATGKVGRHAVAALNRAGHAVTALARRSSPLDVARFVCADLGDADAVKEAALGQDAAFLVTANGEGELDLAEAAIAALESAGVGRLAYLGANNIADRLAVPHFAYKQAIQRRLSGSSLPSLTLAAGYFYQNDAPALAVVREAGVYPSPIGEVGIGAIDVRDIADALANILFDDEYLGRTIPLVGSDVLTGSRAASIWCEVMRRPVRYGGDDTAGLRAALAARGASEWLIEDLCRMMLEMQRQGSAPKAGQAEIARRAIGHEPRRYRAFVAELVGPSEQARS